MADDAIQPADGERTIAWRAVEHAHSVGGRASSEGGLVVVDGPNGTALTLDPDAAEAMGRSLIEAASAARRQAAENSGGDAVD